MKLFSFLSVAVGSTVMIVATIGATAMAHGEHGRVAAAVPQSSDGDSAANISGNWEVSFTGRNGGERQVAMQLKQQGSKLSGTFQGQRGSAPLSGTVQGNEVAFNVKMKRRDASFTGTVEGDKMSGKTEQGASWTATRQ